MQLWVGLGNPGAGYRRNRHNIGYMAVEAIAAAHGFSEWKSSKLEALVSSGELVRLEPRSRQEIILIKPTCFMNQSGLAVAAVMRYYKIPLASVTVFHDELDLAPSRLRVKRGGGAAGHNGLRSLDQYIGADYRRIRLGIGHPGARELVAPFVLGNFLPLEQDWLAPLLDSVAKNAAKLLEGDDNVFASAVSQDLAGDRRN
ncbi:MAG: aminoacyl-tRNA hydrolase [Candidatus Pacebacteria bacterium]|nr:aminoacyl-tRNA hydrolase [Candidatus Paceibacterota bacterium]